MNLADVVVLALAALAAVRGLARGFLGQTFELGGGVAGLVAGAVVGPVVASLLPPQRPLLAALVALLVVLVCLSLGQTVGVVVGHRFGSLARRLHLGLVDSGLGALLGVVLVLFAYWLVGSLLSHGPFPGVARALGNSEVLAWEDRHLPPPPDLLTALNDYLDTAGFPQVFADLPRPVGSPVRLPAGAVARRAVRAADASTVRIVVPGCGGTKLGSGWVSAPGVVVTNAHVVSGGHRGVTVEAPGGAGRPARVVLFDPRTDVAVLRAPGIDAPALHLVTAPEPRGTGGATLGYPGNAGGRLVARPAAVQQGPFVAVGRDIYGHGRVERRIYALRATVRQGDSGGPFVLPDGGVAGMVFAASTTDPRVGYALTGAQIAGDVRRGEASTRPVATGACSP